jgi:hypothetical protein
MEAARHEHVSAGSRGDQAGTAALGVRKIRSYVLRSTSGQYVADIPTQRMQSI